jgi:predicted dehydrogenase
MKKIIRCAVIGVGYLGKFHAEKYALLDNATLVGVCDINKNQAESVARSLDTKAYTNYKDLLNQVDAVSIAVPTMGHYEVAKFFLENHVHVLVEKPITTSVTEANDLIALAEENNLILQVGHLERFNQALTAVEKVIQAPKFIESHRLSTFNPRNTDVNVMLDLMIHDIDLIQYLVKSPIKQIHANGASILTDETDIANARIQFANHCVANVTASRVSFRTERRMRIFQPDAYLTLDLGKKHVSIHRKAEEEMISGIPEIISHEETFVDNDSLKEEIQAFLRSIIQKTPPVVSGEDGKRALSIAIQITELVKSQFDLFEREPLT